MDRPASRRRPAALQGPAARRFQLSPLLLLLVVAAGGSARAQDLPAYLGKPDDSFAWEVATEYAVPGAQVTVLHLTSQTWQGIPWKHWLSVIRPAKVVHAGHALLFVTGGSVKKDAPTGPSGEVQALADIAGRVGAVVAVLGQVPNQPLFGGLKEDGLISHTFLRFLETGDDSWPCLLPMTKSTVRAMDAVQAFAAQKLEQRIEKFFVTGASKRGWTTWLTAAVDARVEGIAPMVIDTLNMAKQMPLQVATFGGYSEQIQDYTKIGLQERLATPEGRRLLAMVDPYSYRDKLTVPKLIVLGTNDRYWPVDAVKLYFGDLPGEKYLHYEPNAGHGLGPQAVGPIAAFFHLVITGQPRPRFSWKLTRTDADATISVTAADAPVSAELWTARSADRDFRDDKWAAAPLEAADGGWHGRVSVPESGYVAAYVSLAYRSPLGTEYKLCTNVEVIGTKP
ncbi:MAG: PhoPQ-activated pathogenicity-like protein PqaA type [Planctomycetes bacterium]|nr:PhoPQ-activated pathogenicity-like protein PqaA type [Planctomycetota bacterium]